MININTVDVLEALTKYAAEYIKDGVNSVSRNRHMNNLEGKMIDQKELEAVVVDFINYVGYLNYVDYGLYVQDIH